MKRDETNTKRNDELRETNRWTSNEINGKAATTKPYNSCICCTFNTKRHLRMALFFWNCYFCYCCCRWYHTIHSLFFSVAIHRLRYVNKMNSSIRKYSHFSVVSSTFFVCIQCRFYDTANKYYNTNTYRSITETVNAVEKFQLEFNFWIAWKRIRILKCFSVSDDLIA